MNPSFHLYQLQKLDSQLDQVEQRLGEIQNALDKDERLVAAREMVDGRHSVLIKSQNHLKRIEQDVETRRIKLEQCEANLYSGRVKNPKELQDLQAEVVSIRKAIATLEDQQLEAMLVVEAHQAEFTQGESEYQSTEAVVLQDQASLNGEKNQLIATRTRLTTEKEASQQQIDSAWLKEYNNLRKKKRGIAIASVSDSACSACGTTLTPSECQTARSSLSIYMCPTCGRILYAG